jgi:carboxypeptidase PM20D1
VNVRIHPRDSIAQVVGHVQSTLKDERVRVTRAPGHHSEPSPPSSTKSAGFNLVARTIRQVFPRAIVSPGLMIATTDSRHYLPVSGDTYRFTPLRLKPSDRARYHGLNERIGEQNYVEIIQFYVQLIRNANRS